MWAYPAKFTPDKERGGFTVAFPDVPEAITEGETKEEALQHAQDALESALQFYIDRGVLPPNPTTKSRKGHILIPCSTQGAIKLSLYAAFRASGITKAELARRIDIPKTNVDRLFDLIHASRLELIEAALAALGKRISIALEDAA